MNKQVWNADQYQEHASFVARLGSPVLQLLDPKAHERILDLGCGDGTLTAEIGKHAGEVVGIDSSQSMVTAAIQKGLTAHVMSGEDITYNNEFDAIFSNATLHWIPDHQKVIRGVARALKENGRFIGEFGGSGNIQTLIEAMSEVASRSSAIQRYRNPWYFPTDKEYREALEQNGFKVDYIELIPRPTPLKSGIQQWLKIFANHAIASMPPETEQSFLADVEKKVTSKLYSDQEGWQADYVRLRFIAQKIQ
jgi:2-isopropylmalate synthase